MWSGDFPRLLRNVALCHRCGVVLTLLILQQRVLASAQIDSEYISTACESLKEVVHRCSDGSSDPDYVKHLLYAGAANCIRNEESRTVLGTCMPGFLLPSAEDALKPIFGVGRDPVLDSLEPRFQLLSCDDNSSTWAPEPQSQTFGAPPSIAPSLFELSRQPVTQVVVANAEHLLGELLPAGERLNLSHLAFVDASLNWLDVLRPLRYKLIDSMGGGPAVLPMDGAALLLIYRGDVLDAMGEQVPRTWNELAAFVESYSASRPSGAPDAALCATTGPSCDGTSLFEAVWHSIAQSKGAKQGVYFSSQTLQPSVTSPAFLSAYRLWERLWRQAKPQPSDRCGFTHPGLLYGDCVMVVGSFEQVKEVALTSRAGALDVSAGSSYAGRTPVPAGAFRVTQLPGSTYILDPETESSLIDCTAGTCPFSETTAKEQRRRLLSTSWINRAPYVPSSVLMGGISSKFSEPEQLLAWHALSYLASPAVSLKLVTAPGSNLGPFRASHFSASATWAEKGYDALLIQEGLDELLSALQHSNLAWGLYMPDGAHYKSAISALLGRLLPSSSATSPSPQELGAEVSKLQADLAGYYSRPRALEAYKEFIQVSYDALPQPSPAVGEGGTARVIGIIVAATVAGLALFSIAAYVAYRSNCAGGARRRLQKHWSTSVPAVSPSTTLLITDIEGSTKLWEELPEAVMGRALQIHHSCLRRVLVRYQGYESATEGDSFILAFHRPDAALAFAVEAQQELLEQNWPVDLLVKEVCAPVYTSAPSGFPLKRPATLEAMLSRMSLRQPQSNQPVPAVLPACLSRSFLAGSPVLSAGPTSPAGNPQEVPADVAFMSLHGRHSRHSTGRSEKTSTAVPAGIVAEATAAGAVATAAADTILVTTSPPLASPDSRLSRPSECPSVPSTSACSTLVPVIGEQPRNEGQQRPLAVEASSPVALPAPVLKPGGLSRNLQVFREQQHQRQQLPQPHPPSRSPSAQQHMHLQYDVGRPMLGLSLTSSSGWAIIHGGVACSALQDEEMSGAATLTAACIATAPAGVGEYLSAPSAVLRATDAANPAAADLGSAQAGGALGSQVPLDTTKATEVAGSSEPLTLLCSSTRPSPRSNRNRNTRGSGGCTPASGTPLGVTPTGSGHGPRYAMKPLMEGPYSSGGMSCWEACTLEESLKAASKQYEEGNNGDRKRRLLWRGLRVRMGLHSGITSASELTLNRASARTVYSGECASVIRAVADSAQGGIVVLTEACRKALAVQQAATGSTHTAASEALLLHIGRYRIRHRDMSLSLYLATCPNLAPRAAMLPPPRNITPVGLTTYAAPVGRAAVAVLNIPDLSALLDWDDSVTDDAMSLIATVLLDQLSEHRGYLVFQDWEHGTVMAAFAFPLDAVRWALHCRQQLSTSTEWAPALLEHELCREGLLPSYPLQGSEPLSTAFRNVLATNSTLPSVAGSGPLPSPASGRHIRRASLDLSHALSISCDHAHLWTAALSGAFAGPAVPVDPAKAAAGGGILDVERDTGASSLHCGQVHRTSSVSADLDAVVLLRPQQTTGPGSAQLPGGSSSLSRVPGASVVREGSGCNSRWGNRQGLQVAQSQGVRGRGKDRKGVIHPALSLPTPKVSTAARPGGGATATTRRASSYIGDKMAAPCARVRSSGINTAGGYLETTITAPPPASSTISAASELQRAVSREAVAAARGSSSATQGQELSEAEVPNRAVGATRGVEEEHSSRTSPVPRHGPQTKSTVAWPNSDDAETEDGGDMFAMHLGDMDGCAPVPTIPGPSASSRGLLQGLSHPATGPQALSGEEAEGRTPVRLRGPRIRVGIDCGVVEWTVSSSRHCLTYNGQPVTTALKLASVAASGHVLATTAVMVQVHNMQIASMARGDGQEEGATAGGAEGDPATGTEGGDGFHTGGSPRGPAVVSTPVHPASTRGGLGNGRHRRQQLFSCRFTPNWEDAIREHEAFLAQANGSWHTTAGVPSGGGGWNSPRAPRLSAFSNAWNWSTNSWLRGKRAPTATPASVAGDTRRSNTFQHSFDMFRTGAAAIPRSGKRSSFQNQPTSGAASSAPFAAGGALLPTYLSQAASHPAPSPARAVLNDDLAGGRVTHPHVSASRLMSSSVTLQTSKTRVPGAASLMPVSSGGGRFSTSSLPPSSVSVSAPSNVLNLPPRALVPAINQAGPGATPTIPRASVIESPFPLYPIGDLPADSSGLHPRPGSTTPEDSFSLSLRYHASKATVTSSMLKSGSNVQGHASRQFVVGSLPEAQPLAESQLMVSQLEGRSTAPSIAPVTAFSSGLLGSLTLAIPARGPPSLAVGNMGSSSVIDSQSAGAPLPAVAVGPVVGALSSGGGAVGVPEGSGHRGSVSGMLQQALRQHRSHAKRLEQQASLQQRLEQQAREQQASLQQQQAAGGQQVVDMPLRAPHNEVALNASTRGSARDSKESLVSELTDSLRQSGPAAHPMLPALPLIGGEGTRDTRGPTQGACRDPLHGAEGRMARAYSAVLKSVQEIRQDAVTADVRNMDASWPAAISQAAHHEYVSGHNYSSYKTGSQLATVIEDSGTLMFKRGTAACGDGPSMLEGETEHVTEASPWSSTAAGLHALIAERNEHCKNDLFSQATLESMGDHGYERRRASTSHQELAGRRQVLLRHPTPAGGASTDEFGGEFEYQCRRRVGCQRSDGGATDGSVARMQTPISPEERIAIHGNRPRTSISGLAAAVASPPGGVFHSQIASSARSSASRDLSLTWSPRTVAAQGSSIPDGTFLGSAGEATSLANSAISDDLDDSRASVRPPAGWRPGVHPPPLPAPPPPPLGSSLPHTQSSSVRAGVALAARALHRVSSAAARSDGAMGLGGGVGGGSGSGRTIPRGGLGKQGSSVYTLSLGRPQSICHNLDEPDMWMDESYVEGVEEQNDCVQY